MRKLLILVPLALALTACQESKRDAREPGASAVNRTAPDHVLAMPDDYPNVATKCAGFGHQRVWVVTHVKTDAPPVITTDESCP